MSLDHRSPKIITVKGQKKVRSRTSGNKSQITAIACVSADEHVIPPFVIFDSKWLNYHWTKREVVGTRYGLSSNATSSQPPAASSEESMVLTDATSSQHPTVSFEESMVLTDATSSQRPAVSSEESMVLTNATSSHTVKLRSYINSMR